jgi:hypothetical protein
VHGVAPHGDGGAMEHRIHVYRSVITHVFAKRAFGFDVALLIQTGSLSVVMVVAIQMYPLFPQDAPHEFLTIQ